MKMEARTADVCSDRARIVSSEEATAARDDSHLLSLPAELRNRIYMFALVHDDGVDLMKRANRTQPAILRTCRQLRNEAIGPYYSLNLFTYTVTDFEIEWIVPFKHLLRHYRPSQFGSGTRIKLAGVPHWANMKLWLQLYHAHRELRLGISVDPKPGHEERSGRKAILRGAVRICNAMTGQPWSVVGEALEGYHQGLKALSPAWN